MARERPAHCRGVGAIERAPKAVGNGKGAMLLPLRMARHEVEEIDTVWPALGFTSRTAFLRRAIADFSAGATVAESGGLTASQPIRGRARAQ